jgi:iron-sulfur cluster assembly accessory protein
MKLTLTDAAIAHIQKMMAAKNGATVFRLSVKKAGCSGYRYNPEILDAAKEGDLQLKISDSFSLFVDSFSVKYLEGCVIDYVIQSHGLSQMVFRNPNSVNECGCGESFHVKEPEG